MLFNTCALPKTDVLSTRDVPSLGQFNDSLLAPSLHETGPMLECY